MSSHKECINEFMASTDPKVQQEAVTNLVDLLQNNQLTLLNFIQALQMYITSTNDTIRISTFTLLSQVLTKISSTKLFPKDIEVLMAFLYSKLLDKPVIKFVLSCIYSLFTMKYFNNENCTELMQKLIDNYNPKENPQSIRLLALKIINYQIEYIPTQIYPNDLAIDCFLHISQNEKDPNNLFLIFQILQKISKNLDINNYIQPLFDTMFRYYPIAFKSSNEAQETQVNSLKDSLNASLASNDLYAAELYPNLIEKYNSATSSQVKLDILTTISVVSKIYSISIIQENFLSLWNTIKYTLINQELAQLVSISTIMQYYEDSSNESDQIFHAALIAIQDVSSRLNDDYKLLIFDDLSKNLILSERNRRFLQSYLTLAVISLPSSIKYNDVDNDDDETLRRTLTQLFSSEQPIEQIKNKRMLLVALSYFSSDSKFITQLIPFRDDILNLLQSSLSSSSLETTLRTLAIQLTSDLILSPTIISSSNGIEFGLFDNERSILIGKLGDLLIENGLQSIRDFNTVTENALLIALCKLSKNSNCENDIMNEVINNILLKINILELPLREKCILLNYLIKISQTSSLVQIVSIRLVNLLPNDVSNYTESKIPVEIILQSLTSLFISLDLSYDMNTITKKFLPILFDFILKQTSITENENNENNEIKISYICEIIRRMIVGLNNEISLSLILEFFKIFKNLFNIKDIDFSEKDNFTSSFGDIENIESKNKFVNYNHIPILLYAIQGLDLEVNLKSKINLIDIIKTLIEILNIDINNKISELTKIQILVGISVIFNKYFSWIEFNKIFSESSYDKTEIKVWALYGLILKCDSQAAESFIELLLSLNFEELSKAIDIIFTAVNEVSDKLVKKDEIDLSNGLNIDVELLCAYKKERSTLMMIRSASKLAVSNLRLRHMWKQRILEILLHKKNTDNSSNINLILPLILTYLPEELYTSHLKILLPGLINTIESYNDESVIISIVKIICNVTVNDSGREMLKPYLNSIIGIVLSYLENEEGDLEGEKGNSKKEISKNLKKQSLRCLLGMCLFDLPVVVPFKKRVISATQIGVSDKSRSVRLLAVSVRQAWEDLGVDLSM
ncbi:hypothetical protein C6P40_002612 [Pichia californica]|uniref:MMS19 nucleotide excision repair protein n=1 Tax=Pichia californica TaxID=460514 RepID=A0A9P6WHV0_9ASCO|nr:hypothetical protein C6P40_002612 [[Candida] californica]